MSNRHPIGFIQILILILLVSLSACSGKQEGKTVANVSVISGASASNLSSFSSGGAIIYGRSQTDGQAFGKVINLASGFSIVLDNGNWDFFAVAWEDTTLTGKQLSGIVRCAVTTNVNLTGSDTSVALNLNNANCNNPVFGMTWDNAGTKQFNDLKIHTCRDLGGVIDPTSTCNNDFNIYPVKHAQGHAGSFKVKMHSFKVEKNSSIPVIDGAGGSLTSDCMNVSASGYALGAGINIPGGNNSPIPVPFFTTLTTYFASTDCGNSIPSKGEMETAFHYGMAKPIAQSKSYYDVSNSQVAIYHLTSDEATCQATDALADEVTPHPFASGIAGTIAYAICTKEQLQHMAEFVSSSSGFNASYRLLRDIDFREDLATYDQDPPLFNMIGSDIEANSGTMNNTLASTLAFQGVFYGNHKKIKYLYINSDDLNLSSSHLYQAVGFFRALGENSKVYDLHFIQPQIDFKKGNMVGLLAGAAKVNSTGQIKIKNITSDWASIDGMTEVGGLIGLAEGNNNTDTVYIENVHHSNLEIRAGFKSGGMVGSFNYPGQNSIQKSSVNINRMDIHNIYRPFCYITDQTESTCDGGVWHTSEGLCERTSYTTAISCNPVANHAWVNNDRIGGLIGEVDNCNNSIYMMSEVTSKGSIFANQRIGGLIGNVKALSGSNQCKIKDSYSTVNILAKGNDQSGTGLAKSGGLIGETPISPADTVELSRCFHTQGGISSMVGFDNSISGTIGAGDIVCSGSFSTTSTHPNASGCVSKSYANARSLASFIGDGYNVSTSVASTSTWYMTDSGFHFPKLRWESASYCEGKHGLSYADGDGTAANPYIICNKTQLAQINSGLSLHYELAQDIDIVDTPQNMPFINSVFTGSLDGNNYSINNLNIENNDCNSAIGNLGLFGHIGGTGKVTNLQLFGSLILSNCSNVGALAGINQGHTEDIDSHGHKVKGDVAVGGLIGKNMGLSAGSSADGMVSGIRQIGGVVGLAQGGIIHFAESSGNINPLPQVLVHNTSSTSFIGGIIGQSETIGTSIFYNKYGESLAGDALLQKSRSHASIQIIPTPGAYVDGLEYIGGLVGNMLGGTIANIENSTFLLDTSSFGTHPSQVPHSSYIGALFGHYQAGNVDKIVSNFQYHLDSTIDMLANWSNIAGQNSGGWNDFDQIIHMSSSSTPPLVALADQFSNVTSASGLAKILMYDEANPGAVGSAGDIDEYTTGGYTFDVAEHTGNFDTELWLFYGSHGPEINSELYDQLEHEEMIDIFMEL